MRIAIAALAAGGCITPYTVGEAGPGALRLTCVEVAVTSNGTSGPSHAPVLRYRFGNVCDHHTTVDLSRVRVVGGDAHGGHVDLRAYDPAHELAALQLDALDRGFESIEYDSDVPLGSTWLDVDLRGLDGDTADTASRWVRVDLDPARGGGP